MGRGSPRRAPGVERARAGVGGNGESLGEKGPRGLEGSGQAPSVPQAAEGPLGQRQPGECGPPGLHLDGQPTPCPPTHVQSQQEQWGLQTSGRGPWPKRSPLACEGRASLPFPGGWLGLCFQQRFLCPPCWTGLPPAWGPDGCDLGFVGRDTGQAQTLRCPGVRAHISGHSSQASYDPPQSGSGSRGTHLGALSLLVGGGGGRGHWSLDSSGPEAPAPTRALHRECPDPPQTPLPGYWPLRPLGTSHCHGDQLGSWVGGRGREPQSSLIQ